jgi:hypothetical protein
MACPAAIPPEQTEALNMEILPIVVATVLVLAMIWYYRSGIASRTGLSSTPVLPPGVSIAPLPLLTESDVLLYNVIRLTVQDQYLIFAQVPLWAFVSVEGGGQARTQVLNRVALKRVDFVLVHPGTREVAQAVYVEESSPRPHQLERQRVIESVLDAAGIKLVKVRAQKTYTAPDMAALLGIESDE